MFDNQYTQNRANKVEVLGNLFPAVRRDTLLNDIISVPDFKSLFEEDFDQDMSYQLIGRVMLLRKMGKSGFFHIKDSTGEKQQCFASLNDMGDLFTIFKKGLDLGDIVHVIGTMYVTKTGEPTLKISSIEVLTKALSPLPEKFHGLEDQETRFRKRYLDMIVNPDTKRTLASRSKIIRTIREFMDDQNFMEVETPILNPIPGGANARPFVTRHNALGVDRYLRIAPELYLKRLIVGGFDLVYEIGRNFRNEGIDATHNPEFTSIEFYAAYTNYQYLMTFIKDMFDEVLNKLNLQKEVVYAGQTINFDNWKAISFKKALIEIGGVPENILDSKEDIQSYLVSKGIEVKEGLSLGKLWEELFDEFVEKKLVDPTFITEYPIEISPLARRSERDPNIAERFELFIAGREIANGFNELNDPRDQYERFKAQVASKDSDDEAMHMDKDYVEALMHGMPPTAGAGIGIDRLVMLLTNSESIKEVIAFPAMK